MTKNLKILLLILGVVVVGTLVALAFQIPGPLLEEIVDDEEFEEMVDDEGKAGEWEAYRNERYNYEIRYPENYRIANLVMEEKLKSEISLKEHEVEKFKITKEEQGKEPSLEDYVVITDMTITEEQDYLKGDYDGEYAYGHGLGPLTAPGNFPAGTILISPDSGLSYVDEIEENINKGGGVWDEDGWEWSDFRIIETNSGIKVRKWKFVSTVALANASITLPKKILSPYPAYDGSSEHIEQRKYFDQIRFWTPIRGYDEELFNKIVSTFRFLD